MSTAIAFSRQIKATLVYARAQCSSEKISSRSRLGSVSSPRYSPSDPLGGEYRERIKTPKAGNSLVIALLLEFKGLYWLFKWRVIKAHDQKPI